MKGKFLNLVILALGLAISSVGLAGQFYCPQKVVCTDANTCTIPNGWQINSVMNSIVPGSYYFSYAVGASKEGNVEQQYTGCNYKDKSGQNGFGIGMSGGSAVGKTLYAVAKPGTGWEAMGLNNIAYYSCSGGNPFACPLSVGPIPSK